MSPSPPGRLLGLQILDMILQEALAQIYKQNGVKKSFSINYIKDVGMPVLSECVYKWDEPMRTCLIVRRCSRSVDGLPVTG